MLSQDERRQLAAMEQHLRRADPAFAARMGAGGRRRFPMAATILAGLIWATAAALVVTGWWLAAMVVAVWATVISAALLYRWRPAARRS